MRMLGFTAGFNSKLVLLVLIISSQLLVQIEPRSQKALLKALWYEEWEEPNAQEIEK
jgi:hypothetical protein